MHSIQIHRKLRHQAIPIPSNDVALLSLQWLMMNSVTTTANSLGGTTSNKSLENSAHYFPKFVVRNTGVSGDD